ncbi:MAG: response regulator [Deltaproteobacteria bacterium]|nr:response regulator [Deltaproteobacteria bacterium]
MAVELIKLIPSLLWFLSVATLFGLFYRPIRDELLPNLTGFKAGGVELSFVRESIDAAIELAEKSPQWKVNVSSEDKERALRRAKKHLAIFRDAQILWVDDHPENNLNERRMFRQLKTDVDTAKSTDEALSILQTGNYDLVISDMSRGKDTTAGLEFVEQLRQKKTTPVIFYVGVFDPAKGVPAKAFGITNRPDELLHLSLDTLERKKS